MTEPANAPAPDEVSPIAEPPVRSRKRVGDAKRKTTRRKVRPSRKTTARKRTARKPVEKRKPGRPAKTPTPEQVRQVEVFASITPLNRQQYALLLNMSDNTFDKYYAQYFHRAIAKGEANGQVGAGAVLAREMRKGNMTALIWYEKTRLGMTEKVHQIVSNPEGGPVEQHVHHSGAVAIGLFLPPNGRDVPAGGQVFPPSIASPSGQREGRSP